MSAGLSKLGAEMKESSPVLASIWNRAASAPPEIENVGLLVVSGSTAAMVATAEMFSLTW